MNILVAHKYFFRGGGTATYILELKRFLESRGHRVVPFTVAYDRAIESEYSRFYVSPPGASDETHLNHMRLSPWRALKLVGRATYSLEAKRNALALVDTVAPDVAFVNNIYSYMSPSILHAFRKRRIPVVMRVTDYNLLCPSLAFLRDGSVCTECAARGLWPALRRRCVKGSVFATAARVASMCMHRLMRIYDCVDLFVAPSRFMRDTLLEAGFDGDRLRHLPSFCPPADVEQAEAAGGEHILFFGRVSAQKGIDTLIGAYALLRPEPPLVIAGGDRDGEMGRLRQQAGEAGVGDRVHFVGHQERRRLYELIRRALFVVVPSRFPDVAPMSVLESLAHGKAVVGSRIGGIPEQVTSECGFLFEPGNVEELAAKMKLLLNDVRLRRRMGEEALHRAQTVYSLEMHCERLLRLFTDVCASATAAEKVPV